MLKATMDNNGVEEHTVPSIKLTKYVGYQDKNFLNRIKTVVKY